MLFCLKSSRYIRTLCRRSLPWNLVSCHSNIFSERKSLVLYYQCLMLNIKIIYILYIYFKTYKIYNVSRPSLDLTTMIIIYIYNKGDGGLQAIKGRGNFKMMELL